MGIERIIEEGIDLISAKAGMVENFISETFDDRDPNRSRPRVSGDDPEGLIDKDSSTEILKFPHDHPRYYMSFGFSEYKRPSQFMPLQTTGIQDYISLPIPSRLMDNNVLDYGEISPGIVVEGMANVWRANDSNRANSDGFVDALKSMLTEDTLKQSAKAVGGTGIQAALQTARGVAKTLGAPDIVDGTLQIAGLADNPFTAVAFAGPKFKEHTFQWTMSPKSEKESATIKKIVDTFKKVSYPELLSLGVGGFYKYPWIVYPSFGPEELQKQLYYFKPCVITNVQINYAPTRFVGFYAGTDAPIAVELQISLKEIELWRNGSGTLITEGLPTVASGDFNDIAYPPSAVRDLGSADE